MSGVGTYEMKAEKRYQYELHDANGECVTQHFLCWVYCYVHIWTEFYPNIRHD